MKTVTFKPVYDTRLSAITQQSLPESVIAQSTAYGLVIHPAINNSLHSLLGYWDVSDPQTGCLVAFGDYPGREGAIAALVQLALAHQHRGGLRVSLQSARQRHQDAD